MARAGVVTDLYEIDWAAVVRPGDLVVWGQASAEPVALTRAIVANRHRIGGFRAFIGMSYGDLPDPARADGIDYISFGGTGRNRALGGALDILPIHYAAFADALGPQRPVLLMSVAPGADDDHFSFGAGAEYLADLLPYARLVIAEVSSALPRTGTGRDVPRSAFDLIVNTDSAPPTPKPLRIGAIEQAIGRYVAGLIEDGSVIQAGIGTIPSAVLGALDRHRDLGVHSGLIGDEIAGLVEAGIVTNARKSIDRGVTVTGLLAGGPRLMRWADRNARLAIRPTSYTHDHAVLSSIDRLVAVNSAIEVDMSGQVNAEVAGGAYVGAIGGAPAFLRGAAASRGGMAIIALPSTAGAASRIVDRLSGPVSTARSDIGVVVTEHGVADLRGRTLRQRRAALIAIAHPDHRAGLDAEPRT